MTETRPPTRREALIAEIEARLSKLRYDNVMAREVFGDGDGPSGRVFEKDIKFFEDAASLLRDELPQGERELLHAIIADCNGLIDPEAHPELNARIEAVLLPCDAAGKCVGASLLRDEGESQTATITACGLSVSQLHRAVARLDKQAECEAGTHEWGGTPAGMQCRWCRVLIAGPLAEAIWKAVAEDQP